MKVLETDTHWVIKCDQCGRHHIPKAKVPNRTWAFDGNIDSPTFTPSINECCNPPGHKDYRSDVKTSRCHFVITKGQIYYCNDCTHKLAGQTVPLPDFTDIEVKLHQFG